MRTTFVVPCYNEADRLRPEHIAQLASSPGNSVLLVNDGSTDGTLDLLLSLPERIDNVEVHDLPTNSGKAEAVRLGLLRAIDNGSAWVAFCDADMATPVPELVRLRGMADAADGVSVILASRVSLLGRRVQRSAVRHYLGRVFATMAGIVLGIRVYDTQCGAKLFRSSPALRAALSKPFHSRWSFDVELLGRLLRGGHGVEPLDVDAFLEVPLEEWSDVGGSKLTPLASMKAGLELFVIAWHLARWHRTPRM